MIKPNLTNFTYFIEKPKQVIHKTKIQIQEELNLYLNIGLLMIIIIGLYYLYRRYKTKEEHEKNTKLKLQKFDNYLKEHIINDMLTTQNNNT